MECSDSEEENNTSPKDNTKYAFCERQVTEQLIAISLVELPDSESSGQENSEQENSENSEEESPGTEERKRATISSQERKRATISSQERKRVTISSEERKRATISSGERKETTSGSEEKRGATIDSDSEEERSWRQLMKEEAEYEKQLEIQVAEMESKSWGKKPSETCRGHELTCSPRNQGYQFHTKPSNLQSWIGESGDIGQLDQCVEALIRSHIYTVMTAMQHSYAKSVPVPRFITWLDWDLDQIKLHPNTIKMSMPRLDIGPDGQQSEKERRLCYLRNGDNNLCLSYAIQSLRIYNDRYLSRFGLEMKEGTFPFTTGMVRYLVLTYDHPKREWIMNRLVDPVVVMDFEAEGCGHDFEAEGCGH